MASITKGYRVWPHRLGNTAMTSVLTRLLVVGFLGALLPETAAAESAPPGKYECWFYSTPQPLQNFSLEDGTYTDASGVSGSVTISGDKMLFSGGHRNGRTGIYNGGNPPTISFYNADGEQVLLCQLAP
jgi:hypothetical protein